MLSGLLKPLVSPLLTLAQPPASATAAVKQDAEPVLPTAQATPDTGVKFDLSERALGMMDTAPAPGGAPAAGMAPASAGGSQPASQQAPASAGAARGTQVPARTEPLSDMPASGRAADESIDPTEEDRARAWAIRGMERDRLMGLIDTLKVTPRADPAQVEVARHTAAQPQVQAAPSAERITAP